MNDRMQSVRRALTTGLLFVACLALPFDVVLGATDFDEFKIKREAVFEFEQKPLVTREGDRVTIAFETEGLCDVTVAIEDADGKIVRHLTCGVLGPNAPEPFLRNSKRQTIIWDGKNDQGVYIDDKDRINVRVSLGLTAQHEQSFLWNPYRRMGANTPVICPTAEGVYVFEGNGFDHLRLFDHKGNYVRTVYPFPADKVDAVRGVKRHRMPQSGRDLPLKWGFYEATLLTCGYTGIWNDYGAPSVGAATRAMAVWKDRIFIPCLSLNRLGTDGSSAGMELDGPKTTIPGSRFNDFKGKFVEDVPPRSVAASPDGKTLYLAGYVWGDYNWDYTRINWINAVGQMDTLGDDGPRVFVGPGLKEGKDTGGSDNAHFMGPSSVACDAKGRVYVADHHNDRIQVFHPDGTHVKTIPVSRPAEVCVHQKTGDIYVFSWLFHGPWNWGEKPEAPVPAVFRHLGPLEDPREISAGPLPLRGYIGRTTAWMQDPGGRQYHAAVDSWTDPPTIWLVPTAIGAGGVRWKDTGLILLIEKDGQLVVKRDFGKEAARALPRLEPVAAQRQRLYVNPKTGKLYVGEGDDSAAGKSFRDLIEIDPATGRWRVAQLPFDAEDLAFDMDGLVYLRTYSEIARYDPATWKEVPFDYGEERERIGTGSMSSTRLAPATSVIVGLNVDRTWHQGGLSVSPKGEVAAAFYCSNKREDRRGAQPAPALARPYTPTLYPGRGGRAVVNVWDKYGRLVRADAIPGLGVLDGLAIDKNSDIYVLAAATRVLDGKRYFDYMTGTAMKFRFGKAKVITTNERARVPLPAGAGPRRPQELDDGTVGPAWADGAQWFYGGLGFTGKDGAHASGGCACWNARFALDYFARSFWPEIQHYSVAVLDTNGNLILRVGKYGNVDDGKPLVGRGGPLDPRSIGGDEVALFYPAYLATHTDRRLFIADPGNSRILSVRLDYHATERVSLRDIKDGSK